MLRYTSSWSLWLISKLKVADLVLYSYISYDKFGRQKHHFNFQMRELSISFIWCLSIHWISNNLMLYGCWNCGGYDSSKSFSSNFNVTNSSGSRLIVLFCHNMFCRMLNSFWRYLTWTVLRYTSSTCAMPLHFGDIWLELWLQFGMMFGYPDSFWCLEL